MNKLKDKCRILYKKYEELILYIISGGITTLVNWGIYYLLTWVFDVNYLVANIAAWAASVVCAFIVNKAVVFRDNVIVLRTVAIQFLSFAAFRVLSGAIETGALYVSVDILGWNDSIMKIAVSVFVVVVNYIFSKLVVFRKK
ncbi:MAG: GtrA family protein [Eubacteriales bacterium]